jgi:hypothetical protein
VALDTEPLNVVLVWDVMLSIPVPDISEQVHVVPDVQERRARVPKPERGFGPFAGAPPVCRPMTMRSLPLLEYRPRAQSPPDWLQQAFPLMDSIGFWAAPYTAAVNEL